MVSFPSDGGRKSAEFGMQGYCLQETEISRKMRDFEDFANRIFISFSFDTVNFFFFGILKQILYVSVVDLLE